MCEAARGFSKNDRDDPPDRALCTRQAGSSGFFDAEKALDRKTFLWYCKFFI
jgi:hypothetical protein